jgi:hypothetical protein
MPRGKRQYYFKLNKMTKARDIRKEALQIKKRLAEIEELQRMAEEEELQRLKDVEEQIKAVIEENNMFCGAYITRKDLLAILEMAFTTTETIKIPFKIYYNE